MIVHIHSRAGFPGKFQTRSLPFIGMLPQKESIKSVIAVPTCEGSRSR